MSRSSLAVSNQRGSLIVRAATAFVSIFLRQFRIASVHDDFLLCRTFDGNTEGTHDVKVAKPYLLRRKPFDGTQLFRSGVSYDYTSDFERTATKNGVSQTEKIVPSYHTGDLIYAIRGITGGTSVTEAGQKITWIDLNMDGRTFARRKQ